MSQESSLKGKIGIVTGGGSGIGRGIALEFASAGVNLVLADINEQKAKKVARETEKIGVSSMAVTTDVSKVHDVDQLVRATIEKFGRIDILVNNAGILLIRKLSETSVKEWDKIMDVNLKGCFLCSRSVAKEMMKQRSGKIINISSLAATRAVPETSAYSASKAGVSILSQVLAVELAPFGINVNTILPGQIDTPMVVGKTASDTPKVIPLRRLGTPADIAKAARFLASEDSSFVTGTTLVVDGGRGSSLYTPPPGHDSEKRSSTNIGSLNRWYSEEIWGKRTKSDDSLFEIMSLQVFQAGLSWNIILDRRDSFRNAFHNWKIGEVAAMNDDDVNRLLLDTSIIKNRTKIEACISNAKVVNQIQRKYGSFCRWFYDVENTDDLEILQKKLRRTFRFMGPELARMWLLASGRIREDKKTKKDN